MWRNLLVFAMIVSWCVFVVAQPTSIPTSGKQAPAMKTGIKSAPPAEMQFKSASKLLPSTQMTTAVGKKSIKEVGTTYVDPPYIASYIQPSSFTDPAWVAGTGYIQTAEVQTNSSGFPNGWTVHQAGSYAYGKAASRCWVKCMFTPLKTGNYEVSVRVWQQGTLKAACGYSSQAYAYRTVGIFVGGQTYQAVTAEELYLNYKSNMQQRTFNAPTNVARVYTLYAGQTYEIWGYTEVGGWSSGDSSTWQTTDVLSYIGPFKIKGLF